MGCLDSIFGGDNQDYAQAARDQGAANVETARQQGYLNNPNIISPGGIHQVTFNPTSLQPTITDILSPEQQNIFDITERIQQAGLGSLESLGMPAIEQAMRAGYKLDGSPAMDYDQKYQPPVGQQYGVGSKQPIQYGLDYSGAPQLPTANAGVRDQVARSMYDQGARFLDDRFAGQQKALDTRLSNQGVFPGSEGYSGGQKELGDERTQAYGDLMDRSVVGGGNAMQQLYDMGMGARQQAVGEINTQGQFVNDAQNQDLNQQLSEMTARNQGVVNQYNIAGQQAGLQNAGRTQAVNEMIQANVLPTNVMNSILSGSQVTMPTTQPYNPTAIETTPVFQGAQAQGASQTANANRTAGIVGSGLSMAGTAM